GVTQNSLLQLGERRPLLKGGQVRQFPFSDPLPSTHGRVEVNSEGAADEHGRLETGEPVQLGGDRTRRLYPALHLSNRQKQPGMVRRDLDGFNEAILARELGKFVTHEPVNQPSEPTGLRWLDALHVSHKALPSPFGMVTETVILLFSLPV